MKLMDEQLAYQSKSYRRPVILLIENDIDLALVVAATLEDAGYSCHTIYHTHDIISLIELHQPKLVIVDYLLPQVNGGELCSSIKEHTQYQLLPVIIYSAYPRVFHSLGNYKCDKFISKPF